MSTSSQDFYQVLELHRTASADEIRRAYKRQALKYHPDKNPPEQRTACEAKFKIVARAYEVLSKEDSRKRYDAGGMAAVDAAAAARGDSDAASSTAASSRRHEPSRREYERRSGWDDYQADDFAPPPASRSRQGPPPRGTPTSRPPWQGTTRDGEVPQSPFFSSPLHAFAFTDPFELFNMIFAESPLTPGFGSPFVAMGAAGVPRRSHFSDREPSSPSQPRAQNRPQYEQRQHQPEQSQRDMMMRRDPLGGMMMGGGGLFGGGIFGQMNAMMDAMMGDMMEPFGGSAAQAEQGFFSSDFASLGGAAGGGARSFSSHTVISNGRAKTVTVKRYTDRDGQVHEERNETEGDAHMPPGFASRRAIGDDYGAGAAPRTRPAIAAGASFDQHRYASRPSDAAPRPQGYGSGRY